MGDDWLVRPSGMDPDEHQEYVCLRLEGHNHEEAAKLARSANDKVNSKRLSGPLTGDTRNGHGLRPIITDHRLEGLSGGSEKVSTLTQDIRTDMERERDWSRADEALRLLGLMAPKQRLLVTDYLGLDTGTPMTAREVAEKHNTTEGVVRQALKRGAARVRRLENRVDDSAERAAKRREYNRQWMANKRSRT